MSIRDELDDRVSPASLDALAVALGVRWPAWYPPFVLQLATAASASRPFWLPGGFLFASPRRVYDETIAFRTGRLLFTGAPSIAEAGPGWPPRPLPTQYVVVGRSGEGPVMVDASAERSVLLWLDKEGYWREPLIDFAEEGKTPVEVARLVAGGPAAT